MDSNSWAWKGGGGRGDKLPPLPPSQKNSQIFFVFGEGVWARRLPLFLEGPGPNSKVSIQPLGPERDEAAIQKKNSWN